MRQGWIALLLMLFSATANSTPVRAVMEGIPATANTIMVDTTNVRVGIGMATPLYPLDVTGATRISSQEIVGGTLTVVGNAFSVNTNNLVVAGGNVGIGNTSPGSLLTVGASGNNYVTLKTNSTSSDAAYESSDGTHDMFWGLLQASGCGSGMAFYNGGCRMTILSNGNVGIGTTGPAFKFHIDNNTNGESNAVISNSNTGTSAETDFYVTSDSSTRAIGTFINSYNINGTPAGGFLSNSGSIGTGAGLLNGLAIMSRASGTGSTIRFYTSGHANERMRIDSSGNVGIGTTNPAQKLDVNGTAQVTTLKFSGDGTTQTTASTLAQHSKTQVTGTFSNSTWGTCLATATITTQGNKVKASFYGSAFNNSGSNAVSHIGFLLDGAFMDGESASVSACAQETLSGQVGNLTCSAINASAPSAASHSVCVWFWSDAAATIPIFDSSHQLNAKNSANYIVMEEIR